MSSSRRNRQHSDRGRNGWPEGHYDGNAESAEMSNSQSRQQQSDRSRNGWPEGHYNGNGFGTPGMPQNHDILSNSSRNGGGDGYNSYNAADDTEAIQFAYSLYLDAAMNDPAWETRDFSHYDDLPEYDWRDLLPNNRRMAPPSDTLYVEGLPSDCTGREIAHIFRPFLGYRASALLESWDPDGYLDEVIGIVQFDNISNAAAALSHLQGYQMVVDDPYSARLPLRFC